MLRSAVVCVVACAVLDCGGGVFVWCGVVDVCLLWVCGCGLVCCGVLKL